MPVTSPVIKLFTGLVPLQFWLINLIQYVSIYKLINLVGKYLVFQKELLLSCILLFVAESSFQKERCNFNKYCVLASTSKPRSSALLCSFIYHVLLGRRKTLENTLNRNFLLLIVTLFVSSVPKLRVQFLTLAKQLGLETRNQAY